MASVVMVGNGHGRPTAIIVTFEVYIRKYGIDIA